MRASTAAAATTATTSPPTATYWCRQTHLQQRVSILQKPAGDGVTGFVVCHRALLFLRNHSSRSFHAANDSVDSFLEVSQSDGLSVAPRSNNGAFVGNVGNVGTGKANGQRGQAVR